MFWKKKKMLTSATEVPVVGAPAEVKPVANAAEVKKEKLPGPRPMSEPVGKYLIKEKDKSPDWVWRLMTVEQKSSRGENIFDIRVFAPYEATEKRVNVKNYASLDTYPQLVLFEGWFNRETKQVEMEEKRVIPKVQILSKAEIRQKIEALTEPGSSVFFYLSASPASGGPLGRGAAVVQFNPKYPGKGQKKYTLSAVSVDGIEPTSKGIKLFDSDKAKDIANWVKERHQSQWSTS